MACYEHALQESNARLDELERQRSLLDSLAPWLARFGIQKDEADKEWRVRFDVALRRKMVFATIADKCFRSSEDADALRTCLEHEERVETALGNQLDQPAK